MQIQTLGVINSDLTGFADALGLAAVDDHGISGIQLLLNLQNLVNQLFGGRQGVSSFLQRLILLAALSQKDLFLCFQHQSGIGSLIHNGLGLIGAQMLSSSIAHLSVYDTAQADTAAAGCGEFIDAVLEHIHAGALAGLIVQLILSNAPAFAMGNHQILKFLKIHISFPLICRLR